MTSLSIYTLRFTPYIALEVDGHRADIMLLKASLALAAYEGQRAVTPEHVYEAAELVLPHRLRRLPFDTAYFSAEQIRQFCAQFVVTP